VPQNSSSILPIVGTLASVSGVARNPPTLTVTLVVDIGASGYEALALRRPDSAGCQPAQG
jgi:hypothetical protein